MKPRRRHARGGPMPSEHSNATIVRPLDEGVHPEGIFLQRLRAAALVGFQFEVLLRELLNQELVHFWLVLAVLDAPAQVVSLANGGVLVACPQGVLVVLGLNAPLGVPGAAD